MRGIFRINVVCFCQVISLAIDSAPVVSPIELDFRHVRQCRIYIDLVGVSCSSCSGDLCIGPVPHTGFTLGNDISQRMLQSFQLFFCSGTACLRIIRCGKISIRKSCQFISRIGLSGGASLSVINGFGHASSLQAGAAIAAQVDASPFAVNGNHRAGACAACGHLAGCTVYSDLVGSASQSDLILHRIGYGLSVLLDFQIVSGTVGHRIADSDFLCFLINGFIVCGSASGLPGRNGESTFQIFYFPAVAVDFLIGFIELASVHRIGGGAADIALFHTGNLIAAVIKSLVGKAYRLVRIRRIGDDHPFIGDGRRGLRLISAFQGNVIRHNGNGIAVLIHYGHAVCIGCIGGNDGLFTAFLISLYPGHSGAVSIHHRFGGDGISCAVGRRGSGGDRVHGKIIRRGNGNGFPVLLDFDILPCVYRNRISWMNPFVFHP